MDYLNKNVAINLRRIRKSRKMSLDLLSVETGISKSMLGQIERGEANPTLATLGKIISGLRVDLQDLVQEPLQLSHVVRGGTLSPIKESKDSYTNFNYFPYEDGRDFEIYRLEISPGKNYTCSSHGENTEEYFIVYAGEATIQTPEESFELRPGDALRFCTDAEHVYFSTGDENMVAFLVFTWK